MSSIYGLSSPNCRAVNMVIYHQHSQCPKGHYDKTQLKKVGRMIHWQCNICGRKFWTELFKPPRSRRRY